MVIVKVSPDAQMREPNLIGAEHFARSADRVVLGMIEVIVVCDIHPNLWREELGIEGRFSCPRIPVQPGPVCEGKWLCFRRRPFLAGELLLRVLPRQYRITGELLVRLR